MGEKLTVETVLALNEGVPGIPRLTNPTQESLASAILDALKRQEEERRRGQAATESAAERLLAQQLKARQSALGTGLVVALGVLMIGGLAFALLMAKESAAPQSAHGSSHRTFRRRRTGRRRHRRAPPHRLPGALSDDRRRVQVSAHIYGELGEDRALWINGQPYGEGDDIDGLMLEAITVDAHRVRRGEERLTRRVTPP